MHRRRHRGTRRHGRGAGSFTLGDGVHHVDLHRDRQSPARQQGRRHRLDRVPGDAQHRSDRAVDLLPRGPADWVAFNVFFGCSSTDDGSGLADPADASFLLSTTVAQGSADANAPTGTHSVSDKAGNSEQAAVLHAKVDLAPPMITCPAVPPVLVQGGPNPSIVATVTDGGSGPASPTATGETSSAVVGPQTADVSRSTRSATARARPARTASRRRPRRSTSSGSAPAVPPHYRYGSPSCCTSGCVTPRASR